MECVITFGYNLTEKVKIKAIETTGHVDGLSFTEDGELYRVIFYDKGGKRYREWFHSWEIESAEEN